MVKCNSLKLSGVRNEFWQIRRIRALVKFQKGCFTWYHCDLTNCDHTFWTAHIQTPIVLTWVMLKSPMLRFFSSKCQTPMVEKRGSPWTHWDWRIWDNTFWNTYVQTERVLTWVMLKSPMLSFFFPKIPGEHPWNLHIKPRFMAKLQIPTIYVKHGVLNKVFQNTSFPLPSVKYTIPHQFQSRIDLNVCKRIQTKNINRAVQTRYVKEIVWNYS